MPLISWLALTLLVASAQADTVAAPPTWDLRSLSVLEEVLLRVEYSYAFEDHVDLQGMYEGALHAAEVRVPSLVVHHTPGSPVVALEADGVAGAIRTPRLADTYALHGALVDVASFIADHVDPADVPTWEPGVDPWAEVEYAMCNGVLDHLDPHSALFPPVTTDEVQARDFGETGGIGAFITIDQGWLQVQEVVPGGAAWQAGVRSGDRLVRIDGVSTLNMGLSEGTSRLRGKVGSTLRLTVSREEAPEPLEVELERQLIRLSPVEHSLLPGRVGLVQVSDFHVTVAAEFKEALDSLEEEAGGRLRGLVLDLRGNPGGRLAAAIEMADRLLATGLIVRTESSRPGEEVSVYAHDDGHELDWPLAILLDAESASASEVLSSALRTNDRAVIIGDRSFGKGLVQTQSELADGSFLRLTTARYIAGPGGDLHALGVPVDVHMVPVGIRERGGQMEFFRYWQARQLREADLPFTPPPGAELTPAPLAQVIYLGKESRSEDTLDPAVSLAREILLAARGPGRAAVLAAMSAPVARARTEAEAALEARLSEGGIDWRSGSTPALPVAIESALTVGGSGTLEAGEEGELVLEVENRSDAPFARLVAITESKTEALDGLELPLGWLPAGASTTVRRRVNTRAGQATEEALVRLRFVDEADLTLAEGQGIVPIHGAALPSLGWSTSLVDLDGDGQLAVGDEVALDLSITNHGSGAAEALSARLVNRSGAALDLEDASFEPETLAPGATATGRLRFRLAEAPPEGGWELELGLVEGERFDQTAVVRQERYDVYSHTDSFHLQPGPLPAPRTRTPPTLELTNIPPEVTSRPMVRLSGIARDDKRIGRVEIVVNGDKVVAGMGATGWLPFTADLLLEEGPNAVSVLAWDEDGTFETRSLVIRRDPVAEIGGQDQPDK